MGRPFLHSTVDTLFHSVNDRLPESIQAYQKVQAATYGAVGIGVVVKGLQ